MATARDKIKNAMRKIGVLRKSENPSADEASDGLVALNNMLASWSNESLLISARVRESFALTPGTGSYTIGTGQTFNTDRPILIISAFVRENNSDYPVEIISDERYSQIGDKSTQSNLPMYLNYDNGYATGTIRLAPVPSAANALHIVSEKRITSIATLDTTFDMPPGWDEAVEYNLAIRLAPEYGVQVPQEVASIAMSSLGNIKRSVLKNRPIDYLADVRGIYQFESDSWI